MSEMSLEQFQARRASRTGKTFDFEGESFTTRAAVPADSWLRRHAPGATLETLDEVARDCLDPASHDAWARIRDPHRANPLTVSDVVWLVDHLLKEASGLPTGGPTASPDGPPATSPSSSAGSLSTAGTPSS